MVNLAPQHITWRFVIRAVILCICVGELHAQEYHGMLFPMEPQALLGADDDAVFYLHFSPQVLSDAELSELMPVIASTAPINRWVPVDKKKDDTIAAIVDRYYDYFAKDDEGCASPRRCFPKTTEALTKLVENTNPDFAKVNRVLLPLVPARGRTTYNPLESYRVLFNPIHGVYEDIDRFSPTAFFPVRFDTFGPVSETPLARDGTVMVVPLRASQLRRLRHRERLHISTGDDTAQIVLYEAKPCTAGTDWLSDSPYLTSVRQRLAQQRATLVERAAKLPLIIIDWDKTTAQSHGRKVFNVVENVLATVLEIPELTQYVQFVALAPVTAADKQQQQALLKAYKQERLKGFRPVDLKEPFEKAAKWVKQYDKDDLANNEINDLVLQALLWEHLRKPGWINMSFGVLSSALELQVLRTEQLRKSPSFVVMAAGNDPVPLNQQSIPQLGASLSRRFVNVTHGHRDGDIIGTFNNPAQLATVSVLAPGCGYSFLASKESGSSFASPYVATASWVAALLTGTPDPAEHMREAIILASRPLPVVSARVESGGAFDPALLLTTRRAHVIRADGTLAAIAGIKGSFSYEKQPGDERTVKITTPSAAADRTLVVHTSAAAERVWFREIDNRTCALTDRPAGDVKLELTLDAGPPIIIDSAADFRAKLRELWF